MSPTERTRFAMAAAAAGLLAACAATEPMKPAAAPAAEAAAPSAGNDIKGKIVWVDLKNSALLVVCEDDAGCKSVQGKKGETYTLVIPESMKKSAGAWKEGGLVSVVFEDRADGGRTVKSVSGP